MKEFDLTLQSLSNGITSTRTDNKQKVQLSECHNLEPVGDNYILHEQVIDMDTDSYDWGNS